MDYIEVKNLEKYQHYKDRHLVWIKWHVSCMQNYQFSCLPDDIKWLFIGLICLAIKCENKIPNDPIWIAKQISSKTDVKLEIEQLLASNLIAACYQNAMPNRVDKIREDKKRIDNALTPCVFTAFGNAVKAALSKCQRIKITDKRLEQVQNNWEKLYSHLNIETEIIKADTWLIGKNVHKKDYVRYINNWLNNCLSRSQTLNAPPISGTPPMTEADIIRMRREIADANRGAK